jgi:hypothetical protein
MQPHGKLATGKPTSYRPEIHDPQVIELGKQGKGRAQMASAMNIAACTLDSWIQKYPTFAEAYARAWSECQAWWEAQLQESLAIPPKLFNTRSLEFGMRNRFPEYRQAVDVAVTTKPEAERSPHSYTDEELHQLAVDELRRMEDARRARLPDPGNKKGRKK